jgi:nucleoid-associated protein YgaU
MRPVTKVILVLSVVALAVGAIWFATSHWGKPQEAVAAKPPAESTPLKDPMAAGRRWGNALLPRETAPLADPDTAPARSADGYSRSEDEGRVVARRSEDPVYGADPPGPVLRPSGVEGEVVTHPWVSADAVGGNTYPIAAGDTLYGISAKFYGDTRYASAIEAANPGLNPRALKVGQRIIIPAKSEVVRPAVRADPSAPVPAPATKVYEVKKGDTLIGIAQRMYGQAAMYKKLFEANKDILSSPNATLQIGQRLRLPEP